MGDEVQFDEKVDDEGKTYAANVTIGTRLLFGTVGMRKLRDLSDWMSTDPKTFTEVKNDVLPSEGTSEGFLATCEIKALLSDTCKLTMVGKNTSISLYNDDIPVDAGQHVIFIDRIGFKTEYEVGWVVNKLPEGESIGGTDQPKWKDLGEPPFRFIVESVGFGLTDTYIVDIKDAKGVSMKSSLSDADGSIVSMTLESSDVPTKTMVQIEATKIEDKNAVNITMRSPSEEILGTIEVSIDDLMGDEISGAKLRAMLAERLGISAANLKVFIPSGPYRDLGRLEDFDGPPVREMYATEISGKISMTKSGIFRGVPM